MVMVTRTMMDMTTTTTAIKRRRQGGGTGGMYLRSSSLHPHVQVDQHVDSPPVDERSCFFEGEGGDVSNLRHRQ
eukprot:758463-Hanusia_phi.AAC.2